MDLEHEHDGSDLDFIANTLAETSDLALTEEQPGVYDDAEERDSEPEQISYDITSWGADLATDMLVSRLQKGDIVIPRFQRDFVWTLRDASRFIESLILGLPVPGIFLSKDSKNRLVVVDGQQRLRSLQAFFENDFKGKSFPLRRVHAMLEGRRYKELEPEQRRTLDNAIIHATIFTQNAPENEQSAMYSVFERLNTGGRRLYPQEIRAAIHHEGGLSDALKRLNELTNWRNIYGADKSERMKDVELILRFFALYEDANYEKPMKTFLNSFMAGHAAIDEKREVAMRDLFETTIGYVFEALGNRAFRPREAFNAAVFDAVMVGAARRLQRLPAPNRDDFTKAYAELLKDQKFIMAYSKATSDNESVANRLRLATEAFERV
jgi:hypothetical protein